MRRLFWLSAACALATLVVFTGVALAQSDNSGLAGSVKDPQGGTVSSAGVKLRSLATGVVRETTTSPSGAFYFTLLPPAKYELTVEATGFRMFRDTDITLQVGQTSHIDVELI